MDALELQAHQLAMTTMYRFSSIRHLQRRLMSTDPQQPGLTEEETIETVPFFLKLAAMDCDVGAIVRIIKKT